MTATERVFRGDSDDVLSMDNEADYGKRFFQMSYKEAIKQRIISDYKILTIAVSDARVARAIAENRILNLDSRDLDEAEARAVATGVALKRVLKEHEVTHAISFHSSIRAAERFRDQQDVLNRLRPRTTNLHISSKKTAGQRADLLREFENEPRALMTNARCLIEGIDVPAIDCVVFADPKQSRIDIVQAAGRALRVSSGKEYGYILLPLVVPGGMDFEEFAETTAFRQVVRIIASLSTQDERIVDEFRAIRQGRIPTGKIVEIGGDVPVGMRMSLGKFAEAITTRIWEGVARLNWRPFEEAGEFVRGLGFKNQKAWHKYSKSQRPPDIPSHPHVRYADKGWEGWADFLGYGNRRPDFLSFKQARTYVRRLGLDSTNQFREWCKSGHRPSNIPTNPHVIYADAGWVSWGDFVGTKHRRGGWLSFKEARAYARSLKLGSVEEWRQHCRARKLPTGIVADPHRTYKDKDWKGYGDWLWTKAVATNVREFWPFIRARAYVHRLGLNSHAEWLEHCRSRKLHHKIPANPYKVYAKAGWESWPDWLGTGRVAVPRWQESKSTASRSHARAPP
jgi:Helicase conserved C-terminal domain